MSQQSLNAFKAKIAEDEELREELSRALGPNGGVEALVTFAKSRGYEIQADELAKTLELSDEELDSVSGGTSRLISACTKGTHFPDVKI